MDYQKVFERYEMKYLIDRQQQMLIQQAFESRMQPDEYGKIALSNMYFDTADNRIIRRSIEKPVYKEKLRIRSYGDISNESPVFVELKKKYRRVVYKRRVNMAYIDAYKYLCEGIKPSEVNQITNEIDYFMSLYPDLSPSMCIFYQRTAYTGKDYPGLRITFDENILFRDTDLSLVSGHYGTPLLNDDLVLMEVKTPFALPVWLSETLSYNRIYKTSFSKYGNAYLSIENNHFWRCISA